MSSSPINVLSTLMAGMDVSALQKQGVSPELLAQVTAQLSKTQTKKVGGGTTRVRKEVPAEHRCMARTWGSAAKGNLGMGPQCVCAKNGGDYCKMHAKKAAECEEPCQWKDGKKFGLFCGRIDQPLTGQDAEGKWNIIWLHPDMKSKMEEQKEAGTFELGPAETTKAAKSSGPKKPRAKKEKKEKAAKAPKAPRGKNAYMFYLESRRAAINADILAAGKAEGASEEDKEKLTKTGKVKVSEVTKVAGAEWKALDAAAKKPFEAQSAADKAAKLKAFEAEQATALASEPASPPVAPVSPAKPTVDAAMLEKSNGVNSIPLSPGADDANAQAQALLAQLQSGNDDIFGDGDSEAEEEEGPWTFTLPDEHKGLSDDGDAAVIKFGDKHYVVAMNWYEDAPDEEVAAEEKVAEVSIGMLPNPTYPTAEGEDATGEFVVKA